MIVAKDLLKFENRDIILKFFDLFRKNKISEESKLKLQYFIKNSNVGTENQKEKFIYYYNLMPGNYPPKTYTEIAKEYKCSPSNIRGTIKQYLNYFVNKQSKTEINIFEKIVNTTRYKNGKKVNLNKLK
mgnify:CR=1 FL=1